jgi:hypothetical protein
MKDVQVQLSQFMVSWASVVRAVGPDAVRREELIVDELKNIARRR